MGENFVTSFEWGIATEMLTTWTDGAFEIEVDVEGRIECEGREWEVGSAPCANFRKTPHRTDDGKYYPVIREAGNTTDYFFLADYHKHYKTQEIIFRPRPGYADKKFSPLSVWETFMPWALPLKAPCRVLWFNADATAITTPQNAEWSLTLLSDGRGGWTRAQSPILLPGPFYSFDRERDAPILETVGMSGWVGWVKEALQKESDCRFALEFAALNDEQKRQRVLRWKRGGLEDFKRVCELIAYSAIEWDVGANGADFDLTIMLEEGIGIRFNNNPLKSQIPDFKRAQKLYAWAYHTYFAHSNEFLYRHVCVRDWLEDRQQLISFPIFPISAHERMENLQRLVQWAEGEGVGGELKEILNSPRDA